MKLLKFYSDSCLPCKIVDPIVEKVANELDVEIISINVSENQEISRKFSITSVPTFILLGDRNQVIDVKVGLVSKPVLKEWIEGKIGQ